MINKIRLGIICCLAIVGIWAAPQKSSAAVTSTIPAITFAGGSNVVAATFPAVTFSGGVYEAKSSIEVDINNVPANGTSFFVGRCRINFSNTVNDNDSTDCASGDVTISLTKSIPSAGTPRVTLELRGVLMTLSNVEDIQHGPLTISGSAPAGTIFTTTGTELASGYINFSDGTGGIVTSNALAFGVVGVYASGTAILNDPLPGNASDHTITIEGIAVDLGLSALDTSFLAIGIRDSILSEPAYSSKNFAMGSADYNNVHFRKKVTGTAGNGTTLTIQDASYTTANAVASTSTITIPAGLAANAADHSITIDGVVIDFGTSAKTANQIAEQIAATNFSTGANYGTGAYTVTNPSSANITFTKNIAGSAGNGSIAIADANYTTINDKVATPTFSPDGDVSSSYLVSLLTETSEATIYYTDNGDIPTRSSTQYSSPITIAQNTTIKAFAIKSGMTDSDIFTELFTIVQPVASSSSTQIHRFWSDAKQGHFYTASESEKQNIIDNDKSWKYEGASFSALGSADSGATPIYRFWSAAKQHHFYTASESEKDGIIANDKSWSFEGVAYHAYANEQSGTTALYRFWSDQKQGHFYTTSVGEKQSIEANDKSWKYEGIAYYVPTN